MISEGELIKAKQEIHREVIKDIPVTKDDGDRIFNITYQLKNGRKISRRYWISADVYDRAFMAMYDNIEYKNKIFGIDNINIENVRELAIDFHTSYYSDNIRVAKTAGDRISVLNHAPEIMAALAKDIEMLSYQQIEKDDNWANISIRFDCTYKDNEKYKIFKEIDVTVSDPEFVVESFNMNINSNFVNTYNVLKEIGLYGQKKSELADRLFLLKLPINAGDEEVAYKGQVGEAHEFNVNSADCVHLDKATGELVAEEIMSGFKPADRRGKLYYVYALDKDADENYGILHMGSYAIAYTEETLPQNLEKFVIK